ncbi:AAA family ATPase [Mesorhizobium sp.]|uniref:AAA family ATPase n=1 Tax=Mesorhizobium sp. TaxID=1871066 RepID=UPI000FE5E763|nr:AAA family ATPase [Mesorhizobium sp.]RWM08948.1 MAG: hypothetical protein EOR71_10565 [Mesorhizobium sp.]
MDATASSSSTIRTETGSGSDPVDRTAIGDFLTLLHEHAAAALEGVAMPGVLNLCRFLPDRGLDAVFRFPVGDISGMAGQAVADAQAGFNVYVEGRTVRRGLGRKVRGSAADTVGVFALVVDSDADKGRTGQSRLAPSLTVETSPGNCHQWLFLDHAVGHAEAGALGDAMRLAGGDSATGKPDQPYRVAGTPNYPDQRKRERGRCTCRTRILSASGAVYGAAALRKAYPPSAGSEAGNAGDDDEDLSIDELLAFLDPRLRDDITRAPEPGDDRSARAFSVIMRLILEGFSDRAIARIFAAHPDGIGQRYQRNGKDLGADIARARRKASQHQDDQPGAGQDKQDQAPGVRLLNWHEYRQRHGHQGGTFLIKELVRAGTLISVNGRPGACKTALLLELARCLDAGAPFLDRETKPSVVVYIATEDEADIVNRLEALELDGVMIVASEEGVPLTKPDKAAAVIREVIRQTRERFPGREIFIPFDTLRAGLDGQSVLDDRFTSPALNKLRKLAEDEGVVICVVNHTNRENPKQTKGETLESAVALELILLEGEGGWFELHVGKNRSGPPRRQIGRLRCASIQVGDVEAAIIDQIESVDGRAAAEKPRKPGDSQALILTIMRNAVLDHGFPFRPYPDGPQVKAVKETLLRETFIERKAGDDRDNKRRSFVSALNRLLNRTLMRGENTVGEGVVWFARKDDETGNFEGFRSAGREA